MKKMYDKNIRFCLEIRPVGNYCPNKCSFCYQIRDCDEVQNIMSPELCINVLNKLSCHFSKMKLRELKIVFHGGEPAYDGGIWVSNAAKRINKWTSKYLSGVKVSFSCHVSGFIKLNKSLFINNNIHVAISRHGSASLLNRCGISAVKVDNLNYNISEFETNGLLLKQNIVITKINLNNPGEVLNIIRDRNLPTKLIPQFPGAKHKEESIFSEPPSNSEISKFYQDLIILANNNNISLSNVEPINRFANYLHDRTNTAGCRFSLECPFSQVHFRSLAINYDGQIYPCNRFAGIQTHSLSHMNSSNLIEEINDNLHRLRQKHGYRTEKMIAQCNNCIVKDLRACPAIGGCSFLSYIYKSTIVDSDICTDPQCEAEGHLFRFLYNC